MELVLRCGGWCFQKALDAFRDLRSGLLLTSQTLAFLPFMRVTYGLSLIDSLHQNVTSRHQIISPYVNCQQKDKSMILFAHFDTPYTPLW